MPIREVPSSFSGLVTGAAATLVSWGRRAATPASGTRRTLGSEEPFGLPRCPCAQRHDALFRPALAGRGRRGATSLPGLLALLRD